MCAVKAAKYYIMGKYKLRYTINYNLLSPDFKQISETDVKNLLELSFGKSCNWKTHEWKLDLAVGIVETQYCFSIQNF